MKLRIIIYTSEFHSYKNWRERLAYHFRDGRDKSLASANNEEVEQFWDKFYQEEFVEQFSVDVNSDTKVYELTKELVEKYKASIALNKGTVGFETETGQKFIIRLWDYSFERAYLIHIPSGRRILEQPKPHRALWAVPENDWRTLADEGIKDHDILGLVIPIVTGHAHFLSSVASSDDIFNTIRSANGSPPEHIYPSRFTIVGQQKPARVWGALLYTEEDEELAVYVRKHFASLSQASGEFLHIFVIEKPDNDWTLLSQYWRTVLQEKLYVIWSTMGWLSSRPYDKSQAYEIARTLGVYADQLPCLVLFDDKDSMDKIVFPILHVSPEYFRNLFSAIERALQHHTAIAGSPYETIKKSYAAIVKSLKTTMPISVKTDRSQYDFGGHAAFINRPQSLDQPNFNGLPQGTSESRGMPIMSDSRTSILFLAADPTDASRLRLGEEFREIDEQLILAKQRGRFNLALPQLSLRPKDITRALLNVQPQIVHFSGHGTPEGALCFENEIGQTHLVQSNALAALFEQFADQVNCVLLNACYSEAQAEAIAEHIEYVIGMSQAIGDDAAIAFAVGFYQALGAGRTIEDAYKLGCVQIRLQGIPEHLTPVLITKGVTQP